MDHYSYLVDQRHILLVTGIIVLLIVGAMILTGEAPEREGMVDRYEEPRRFRSDIVIYCGFGLLLLGRGCTKSQSETATEFHRPVAPS